MGDQIIKALNWPDVLSSEHVYDVLSSFSGIKVLFFKPGCSVLFIAFACNNINGILGVLLCCFVTDKPADRRKRSGMY